MTALSRLARPLSNSMSSSISYSGIQSYAKASFHTRNIEHLTRSSTWSGEVRKVVMTGRFFAMHSPVYPYGYLAHRVDSRFRAVTQFLTTLKDQIPKEGFLSGTDLNVPPNPDLAHISGSADDPRSLIAYSNGHPDKKKQAAGHTDPYTYEPSNNYVGVLEEPIHTMEVAQGTAKKKGTTQPTAVYEISAAKTDEYHSVEAAFTQGEKALALYRNAKRDGTLPRTLTPELQLGKFIDETYSSVIKPDGTFNRWPVAGEWVHIGRILADKIIQFRIIPATEEIDDIETRYVRHIREALVDTVGEQNVSTMTDPISVTRVERLASKVLIDHVHLPSNESVAT